MSDPLVLALPKGRSAGDCQPALASEARGLSAQPFLLAVQTQTFIANFSRAETKGVEEKEEENPAVPFLR